MKEYIIYKCKICHKNFILHKTDVSHSERANRYITCPFNGKHKDIVVTGAYDSIKEVMDNHAYVREKGRIRQVK